MKDKLENLPLFNGRKGEQTYDYDFSLHPDGLMRDMILTINKEIIEQFVSACKAENVEPSEMTEALFKAYLEQRD